MESYKFCSFCYSLNHSTAECTSSKAPTLAALTEDLQSIFDDKIISTAISNYLSDSEQFQNQDFFGPYSNSDIPCESFDSKQKIKEYLNEIQRFQESEKEDLNATLFSYLDQLINPTRNELLLRFWTVIKNVKLINFFYIVKHEIEMNSNASKKQSAQKQVDTEEIKTIVCFPIGSTCTNTFLRESNVDLYVDGISSKNTKSFINFLKKYKNEIKKVAISPNNPKMIQYVDMTTNLYVNVHFDCSYKVIETIRMNSKLAVFSSYRHVIVFLKYFYSDFIKSNKMSNINNEDNFYTFDFSNNNNSSLKGNSVLFERIVFMLCSFFSNESNIDAKESDFFVDLLLNALVFISETNSNFIFDTRKDILFDKKEYFAKTKIHTTHNNFLFVDTTKANNNLNSDMGNEFVEFSKLIKNLYLPDLNNKLKDNLTIKNMVKNSSREERDRIDNETITRAEHSNENNFFVYSNMFSYVVVSIESKKSINKLVKLFYEIDHNSKIRLETKPNASVMYVRYHSIENNKLYTQSGAIGEQKEFLEFDEFYKHYFNNINIFDDYDDLSKDFNKIVYSNIRKNKNANNNKSNDVNNRSNKENNINNKENEINNNENEINNNENEINNNENEINNNYNNNDDSKGDKNDNNEDNNNNNNNKNKKKKKIKKQSSFYPFVYFTHKGKKLKESLKPFAVDFIVTGDIVLAKFRTKDKEFIEKKHKGLRLFDGLKGKKLFSEKGKIGKNENI